MKKKFFTSLVGLLAVATLTACAAPKTKTEASSSSSDSSSKVEKSSSSSKASSSSSAASSSAASSSAAAATSEPLITDEELNAAQTLGDYKALYAKLVDNYLARIDAMAEKLPASSRESFATTQQSLKESMETAKTTFNNQLSQAGDDSTVVPDEVRASFNQTLKSASDGAQKMLEQAESMVQ